MVSSVGYSDFNVEASAGWGSDDLALTQVACQPSFNGKRRNPLGRRFAGKCRDAFSDKTIRATPPARKIPELFVGRPQ